MWNILILMLSAKVHYCISHHKSSQAMLNTLYVFYEGTWEIKNLKINTMIEKDVLSHMDPGETMESMHTHFFHLINKLNNLGNTFSKKECFNKVLRSMCKEWQLNVTAIKESIDLNNLDIKKLFGKMTKHKNEQKRPAREVSSKRKKKFNKEKQYISLKTLSSKTKNLKDNSDNSNKDNYNKF